MSHVHERIPLVMTGTVGSHPGRDGFTATIFHSLRQVLRVTCRVVEFNGAQFHVIHPIVFLIDIGRNDAYSLGVAGLVNTHLIGIGGLSADFGCKLRIVRSQHLSPQGKITRKFTGSACSTHRGVEIFASLLRLAVNIIDGAPVIGSPTIVGRVILRQFHADVVTVIGNLVIEFPLGGIHFIEPCQAPVDFVNDVGDAIGALQAIRLVMVTECRWALLPCQHHLVDGIGTRGGILQQVGGIMPTATHIDALPFLIGMITHIGILDVATVTLKRVEAATLLTHVIKDKVSSAVPHTAINRENR